MGRPQSESSPPFTVWIELDVLVDEVIASRAVIAAA